MPGGHIILKVDTLKISLLQKILLVHHVTLQLSFWVWLLDCPTMTVTSCCYASLCFTECTF